VDGYALPPDQTQCGLHLRLAHLQQHLQVLDLFAGQQLPGFHLSQPLLLPLLPLDIPLAHALPQLPLPVHFFDFVFCELLNTEYLTLQLLGVQSRRAQFAA
jgi:hypothetical protein